MAIQEVRIGQRQGQDNLGLVTQKEVREVLGVETGPVETVTVYRFEGINADEAERLRVRALTNPITEHSVVKEPLNDERSRIIEIGYKPGVMNPVEDSLLKVARHLGVNPLAVSASTEYVFDGRLSPEDQAKIGQHLVSQVKQVITKKPETLIIGSEAGPVLTVSVRELTPEQLLVLSKERRLFLNLAEMQVIQRHYQELGREPTDVEIETLAQTWSEHNGHKTFKAKLVAPDGQKKLPLIKRIRQTAEQHFNRVGVVTAFKDNAGGISFYDGQVIIAKGETHNSPVAVEPYGGSLTKNGGVYRDIAGCGKGGKNLVCLMANCFAPPDTEPELVPEGCLAPKYLLLQNSRGERDYGNRMGIPTHATSLHFHPDFVAKPTSLGIVMGIIPEEYSQKSEPKPDSLLVSVGGKTGRDGIHGATFSSGEMTAETKKVDGTAVQIGNAIEEKRTFDALIACRDAGLIEAITDCGGGGYSAAVGEFAESTGVEVNLEKVPLKYAGLSPWEIWLSESQERMIVAVEPNKLAAFAKICQRYNTPFTAIGTFTGDNILTLKYGDQIVGQMPMEFLHHGLPQREMKIKYTPFPEDNRVPEQPTNWTEAYKAVLSHLNVCSTEEMLRQYDQTVQGTTVLPPFGGVNQDCPNDASVIAPIYGKPYGVVTAHGLNPILNRIDPYWGSVWAATEAVANFIAAGGDLRKAAFIDNFIWPFPDEESLGDLDRSVEALCDMMNLFEVPCVSGKDSLSSTYRAKDGTVTKIPPVLNLTVFGKIPDVAKTVSTDIKSAGSTLCLVGRMDVENLGGSVYFDTQGILNSHLPKVDLQILPQTLKKVYEAIQTGKVRSCHDVAEGGLAVTLAEMCFGGDCGADLDLSGLKALRPDFALFNETTGCLVVEVENEQVARELFDGVPHVILGKTKEEKKITVKTGKDDLFSGDLEELRQAWKRPIKEIFD